MSRLDLLKKTSSTSQKKTSTKSSLRGGMLGQKSQQNSDDLADDLLLDFHHLEYSQFYVGLSYR